MKSLDGLHPVLMRPRVEAVLADPEAQARGVFIVSAFRSLEHQKRLFDAAVKKYGSAAAARKWVAAPGRSNHGPKVEHTDGEKYGIAVDFGLKGVTANSQGQWPQDVNDWFGGLAGRHGLYQRMPWEDWHYEPIPHWTPPEVLMFKDDDEHRALLVLEAFALHFGPNRPVQLEEIAFWQTRMRSVGPLKAWQEIAASKEAQKRRALLAEQEALLASLKKQRTRLGV